MAEPEGMTKAKLEFLDLKTKEAILGLCTDVFLEVFNDEVLGVEGFMSKKTFDRAMELGLVTKRAPHKLTTKAWGVAVNMLKSH